MPTRRDRAPLIAGLVGLSVACLGVLLAAPALAFPSPSPSPGQYTLTLNPDHGQMPATFKATYTIGDHGYCSGASPTVYLYWDTQAHDGHSYEVAQQPMTCPTTVLNGRADWDTAPGAHMVRATFNGPPSTDATALFQLEPSPSPQPAVGGPNTGGAADPTPTPALSVSPVTSPGSKAAASRPSPRGYPSPSVAPQPSAVALAQPAGPKVALAGYSSASASQPDPKAGSPFAFTADFRGADGDPLVAAPVAFSEQAAAATTGSLPQLFLWPLSAEAADCGVTFSPPTTTTDDAGQARTLVTLPSHCRTAFTLVADAGGLRLVLPVHLAVTAAAASTGNGWLIPAGLALVAINIVGFGGAYGRRLYRRQSITPAPSA